MRRIVIAEMLILGLWALYLGIVLTQASGNEVKHASEWGQTRSQSEFPVRQTQKFRNTKFRDTKASYPAGHAAPATGKATPTMANRYVFVGSSATATCVVAATIRDAMKFRRLISIPVAAKEMQDHQLSAHSHHKLSLF